MQNAQRFKNLAWIGLVVLAFLIVYLVSWTPVYVEGDDAASVIYHATGEHVPNLGPYSPYQSGMDVVLHFLPANEAVLRPVGMAITATAAILTPILMYLLAFDWLGEDAVKRRWLTAMFVLLATPEFFYLGLVYLPSMVAICGVVAAHLVLRRTLRNHSPDSSVWRRPGIYLAIVLYALGSVCRWDIATYGAVIAVDIFIGTPHGKESWTVPFRQRVVFGLMWGLLAIVALVAMIWISGYSPTDLLATSQTMFSRAGGQGEGAIGDASGSLAEGLGGQIVYFTPVALVLIIVGFGTLISRRSPLLLPIVVGLVVVIPWLGGGAPKFLLPAIPGITVCLVLGFEILWWAVQQPALRTGIRAALIVGLAAIWLIGIQVDTDAAWGPGFQLRDYDRPATDNTRKFSIGFSAGLVLPLSEGPRALFGHAYVLLGGQWRNLVTMLANEQEKAARAAISKNLPELRSDWQKPGLAVFVKLGYTITRNDTLEDLLDRWNFADGNTNAALWALVNPNTLYDKADVDKLLQATNQDTVVLVGYPGDMRKLYQLSPTSLEKLGSASAVLNLKTLSQTLP